jgi:hypothetical protein
MTATLALILCKTERLIARTPSNPTSAAFRILLSATLPSLVIYHISASNSAFQASLIPQKCIFPFISYKAFLESADIILARQHLHKDVEACLRAVPRCGFPSSGQAAFSSSKRASAPQSCIGIKATARN